MPGRISDAEALWYDLSRWPSFIEGFHHAVGDHSGWPERGDLVWDSVPGGRGRVWEKVTSFEARVGQSATFEDEKSTGRQTIGFEALPDDTVRVTLELRYTLKQQPLGPLWSVVDFLFIRPRQREALARTLSRFARELESDRALVMDN